MTTFSVSAANYLDWEKENQVYDRMAIYAYHGFTLTAETNRSNSMQSRSRAISSPLWA